MTAFQYLSAIRLQIRDTVRQAAANQVLWVLLGACAVVLLFCMGIRIQDGESLRAPDDIALDKPHGFVSLIYGAWRVPLFRDGQAMVHFLLLALGEGVFGIVGTFLALVMTAGFIPEFLQPANATVLLSKPTPRWVLLLGRYLGVMTVLSLYAGVYVVGTWLTFGLCTGFWVNSFLWGLPLLLLGVAVVYSFSAFLGVWTRSNLVCVVGSIVFWMMCWGMNYGHHTMVVAQSDVNGSPQVVRGMADACYWILPKPADLSMMLHAAVDGGQGDQQLQRYIELGAFNPAASILSSLAFIVVMVALSAQQLKAKEY
jgi:hypothetical protein